MTSTAMGAMGQRLAGEQVSRPRALFASLAAGMVVTALTYRWLRSGGDES